VYLDKVNYSSELYQSKYLNITLVWNEGIAFGLFSFDQNHLYNLLTLIISIIVFIVFIMMIKSYGLKKYSLIMIFGGALGNLYDRIFFKAVPDFIDFHISNFHWFIFNIADIFITVGVIFMILHELIVNNNKYEKN
jgi:signal peptidase II